MYHIRKLFKFEAAHFLPDHDGQCKHFHGHSYKVQVILASKDLVEEGPKRGMVVDFGDVSRVWKEVLEPQFDHQLLNNVIENPTAENLARVIFTSMSLEFPQLERVRVYETDTSWAEYCPCDENGSDGE